MISVVVWAGTFVNRDSTSIEEFSQWVWGKLYNLEEIISGVDGIFGGNVCTYYAIKLFGYVVHRGGNLGYNGP